MEFPLVDPMAVESAEWLVDMMVELKVGQTAEHSVVSLADTMAAGLVATLVATKAVLTVVSKAAELVDRLVASRAEQ